MSNPIVNRNIVLFPPPEVTALAIAQSKFIAEQTDTALVLNEEQYRPHLTLHQFAIPEQSLPPLEKFVRAVAEMTGDIEVNLNSYSLFGGTGIFWDAAKEGDLSALHKSLVTSINDLRAGYVMKQHADFLTGPADIGCARREMLSMWGNPLAMQTFWPHITLAPCTTQEGAVEALAQLKKNPQTAIFRATSLHITEVGPNGSCPGSLLEIPFGNPAA